jgi:hypothetical protein
MRLIALVRKTIFKQSGLVIRVQGKKFEKESVVCSQTALFLTTISMVAYEATAYATRTRTQIRVKQEKVKGS